MNARLLVSRVVVPDMLSLTAPPAAAVDDVVDSRFPGAMCIKINTKLWPGDRSRHVQR